MDGVAFGVQVIREPFSDSKVSVSAKAPLNLTGVRPPEKEGNQADESIF